MRGGEKNDGQRLRFSRPWIRLVVFNLHLIRMIVNVEVRVRGPGPTGRTKRNAVRRGERMLRPAGL